MKRRLLLLLPLLLLGLGIVGCQNDGGTSPNSDLGPGTALECESILNLSVDYIGQVLALAGIDVDLPMTHAVTAYRLTYLTTDIQGNYAIASAALMLPKDMSNPPLLSIQHGTETLRTAVASQSPFNALEGVWGLVAASRGYAVVIPDYLGLGVSECIHPYHVAKATANAVIDAIRAARQYCDDEDVDLDSRLFLAGYSEGGYATLAAQRAIENEYSGEFSVTASAPMAGAYDFAATARYIAGLETYGSPTYLAFILTAYNDAYGWDRLSEMFQSPYDAQMTDLFDGTLTAGQIGNQLPEATTDMLQPAFRTAVLAGTDASMEAALAENTLLDWAPLCPTHLWHGGADTTVPPFNGQNALTQFTALGAANVELDILDGLDHVGAALPAILAAMHWFETFWPLA